MFATYRIFSGSALVRITYRQHPSFEEWVALMDLIFADPAFVPGMRFLLDKRDVGPIPDQAYVDALVTYYEVHHKKFGRCAVVISDPLAFGMSRMVEGQSLDDRVQTFYRIEEAERWLAEEA